MPLPPIARTIDQRFASHRPGRVAAIVSAALAIRCKRRRRKAGSGVSVVSCAPAARIPGGGVGEPFGSGLGVGFCGVSKAGGTAA